eukprot:Skav223009  [mRNA]  locus=scaffold1422:36148:36393:+ [translate_table: standard]
MRSWERQESLGRDRNCEGSQLGQINCRLRLEGRVSRGFQVSSQVESREGTLSEAQAEQFCLKLQQDGLTVSIERIPVLLRS